MDAFDGMSLIYALARDVIERDELDAVVYGKPKVDPETWGRTPEALEAQRQAELIFRTG